LYNREILDLGIAGGAGPEIIKLIRTQIFALAQTRLPDGGQAWHARIRLYSLSQ